jgi:hypothetical protein
LGSLESRDFGVGLASDRNQHTVKKSCSVLVLQRSAFERCPDSCALFFQRGNGSVQQNGLEHLLETLVQGKHQIAIRSRKQARQHFHHRDAGSESGVYRAEFQADVSAANNQKSPGDIFQIECAGGIH